MRKNPRNTVHKAYDKILQIVVTAQEAAINDGFESDRYICVVCEEEVNVAAANSTERAVHFRHRRGNNNVECEFYLRNSINNSSEKNRIIESGEVYFDQLNKIFCLGLRFKDNEIEELEKRGVVAKLRSNAGDIILEIPIRRENFSSETDSFFPLSVLQ